MRVTVDAGKCQGHTLCNLVAPEVFGLSDEDGHAFVKIVDLPPELESQARQAASGCPEQAIAVAD